MSWLEWIIVGCFVGILATVTLATIDAHSNAANATDADTYDVAGYGYIRDFRLRDGTRCVTTTKGGIACDWTLSSNNNEKGGSNE